MLKHRSSGWRSGCPPWTPRAGRSTSTRPGHRKRGLPVRRRLPGRAERQGSRGVQRREHGRRDPCEPGRRARRGPRAPLDGRARRVRGRAPAHGPRVREGFHPTASRVVRPDAGRNPKRNRTAPWDYDRKAHKGRNMVERVFNRMKHHRKAATRHDRLDETFLANLQLIPIAIYLKNTAKNPISVNTP
ncbi:transposase [Bifidobacterium longum subsp. longum]|nr:transposase [Bifidobacterium longum]MBK5041380.1 transposase [Bifidobacterium longum subsp. longum]